MIRLTAPWMAGRRRLLAQLARISCANRLNLNQLFILLWFDKIMIISHARRFIVFPDPLGAGQSLMRALAPWNDVEIAQRPRADGRNPFFQTMTPGEVEWAFDALGLAYKNYLSIAVVQHPFSRLSLLYDKIAHQNFFWQMRHLTGVGLPEFNQWLAATRPDGHGAGGPRTPRWQRFGAWSHRELCKDHINLSVRAEALEEDIAPALEQIGIAPSFGEVTDVTPDIDTWVARYNPQSSALMMQRYGWDLAQFGYSAPRLKRAA